MVVHQSIAPGATPVGVEPSRIITPGTTQTEIGTSAVSGAVGVERSIAASQERAVEITTLEMQKKEAAQRRAQEEANKEYAKLVSEIEKEVSEARKRRERAKSASELSDYEKVRLKEPLDLTEEFEPYRAIMEAQRKLQLQQADVRTSIYGSMLEKFIGVKGAPTVRLGTETKSLITKEIEKVQKDIDTLVARDPKFDWGGVVGGQAKSPVYQQLRATLAELKAAEAERVATAAKTGEGVVSVGRVGAPVMGKKGEVVTGMTPLVGLQRSLAGLKAQAAYEKELLTAGEATEKKYREEYFAPVQRELAAASESVSRQIAAAAEAQQNAAIAAFVAKANAPGVLADLEAQYQKGATATDKARAADTQAMIDDAKGALNVAIATSQNKQADPKDVAAAARDMIRDQIANMKIADVPTTTSQKAEMTKAAESMLKGINDAAAGNKPTTDQKNALDAWNSDAATKGLPTYTKYSDYAARQFETAVKNVYSSAATGQADLKAYNDYATKTESTIASQVQKDNPNIARGTPEWTAAYNAAISRHNESVGKGERSGYVIGQKVGSWADAKNLIDTWNKDYRAPGQPEIKTWGEYIAVTSGEKAAFQVSKLAGVDIRASAAAYEERMRPTIDIGGERFKISVLPPLPKEVVVTPGKEPVTTPAPKGLKDVLAKFAVPVVGALSPGLLAPAIMTTAILTTPGTVGPVAVAPVVSPIAPPTERYPAVPVAPGERGVVRDVSVASDALYGLDEVVRRPQPTFAPKSPTGSLENPTLFDEVGPPGSKAYERTTFIQSIATILDKNMRSGTPISRDDMNRINGILWSDQVSKSERDRVQSYVNDYNKYIPLVSDAGAILSKPVSEISAGDITHVRTIAEHVSKYDVPMAARIFNLANDTNIVRALDGVRLEMGGVESSGKSNRWWDVRTDLGKTAAGMLSAESSGIADAWLGRPTIPGGISMLSPDQVKQLLEERPQYAKQYTLEQLSYAIPKPGGGWDLTPVDKVKAGEDVPIQRTMDLPTQLRQINYISEGLSKAREGIRWAPEMDEQMKYSQDVLRYNLSKLSDISPESKKALLQADKDNQLAGRLNYEIDHRISEVATKGKPPYQSDVDAIRNIIADKQYEPILSRKMTVAEDGVSKETTYGTLLNERLDGIYTEEGFNQWLKSDPKREKDLAKAIGISVAMKSPETIDKKMTELKQQYAKETGKKEYVPGEWKSKMDKFWDAARGAYYEDWRQYHGLERAKVMTAGALGGLISWEWFNKPLQAFVMEPIAGKPGEGAPAERFVRGLATNVPFLVPVAGEILGLAMLPGLVPRFGAAAILEPGAVVPMISKDIGKGKEQFAVGLKEDPYATGGQLVGMVIPVGVTGHAILRDLSSTGKLAEISPRGARIYERMPHPLTRLETGVAVKTSEFLERARGAVAGVGPETAMKLRVSQSLAKVNDIVDRWGVGVSAGKYPGTVLEGGSFVKISKEFLDAYKVNRQEAVRIFMADNSGMKYMPSAVQISAADPAFAAAEATMTAVLDTVKGQRPTITSKMVGDARVDDVWYYDMSKSAVEGKSPTGKAQLQSTVYTETTEQNVRYINEPIVSVRKELQGVSLDQVRNVGPLATVKDVVDILKRDNRGVFANDIVTDVMDARTGKVLEARDILLDADWSKHDPVDVARTLKEQNKYSREFDEIFFDADSRKIVMRRFDDTPLENILIGEPTTPFKRVWKSEQYEGKAASTVDTKRSVDGLYDRYMKRYEPDVPEAYVKQVYDVYSQKADVLKGRFGDRYDISLSVSPDGSKTISIIRKYEEVAPAEVLRDVLGPYGDYVDRVTTNPRGDILVTEAVIPRGALKKGGIPEPLKVAVDGVNDRIRSLYPGGDIRVNARVTPEGDIGVGVIRRVYAPEELLTSMKVSADDVVSLAKRGDDMVYQLSSKGQIPEQAVVDMRRLLETRFGKTYEVVTERSPAGSAVSIVRKSQQKLETPLYDVYKIPDTMVERLKKTGAIPKDVAPAPKGMFAEQGRLPYGYGVVKKIYETVPEVRTGGTVKSPTLTVNIGGRLRKAFDITDDLEIARTKFLRDNPDVIPDNVMTPQDVKSYITSLEDSRGSLMRTKEDLVHAQDTARSTADQTRIGRDVESTTRQLNEVDRKISAAQKMKDSYDKAGVLARQTHEHAGQYLDHIKGILSNKEAERAAALRRADLPAAIRLSSEISDLKVAMRDVNSAIKFIENKNTYINRIMTYGDKEFGEILAREGVEKAEKMIESHLGERPLRIFTKEEADALLAEKPPTVATKAARSDLLRAEQEYRNAVEAADKVARKLEGKKLTPADKALVDSRASTIADTKRAYDAAISDAKRMGVPDTEVNDIVAGKRPTTTVASLSDIVVSSEKLPGEGVVTTAGLVERVRGPPTGAPRMLVAPTIGGEAGAGTIAAGRAIAGLEGGAGLAGLETLKIGTAMVTRDVYKMGTEAMARGVDTEVLLRSTAGIGMLPSARADILTAIPGAAVGVVAAPLVGAAPAQVEKPETFYRDITERMAKVKIGPEITTISRPETILKTYTSVVPVTAAREETMLKTRPEITPKEVTKVEYDIGARLGTPVELGLMEGVRQAVREEAALREDVGIKTDLRSEAALRTDQMLKQESLLREEPAVKVEPLPRLEPPIEIFPPTPAPPVIPPAALPWGPYAGPGWGGEEPVYLGVREVVHPIATPKQMLGEGVFDIRYRLSTPSMITMASGRYTKNFGDVVSSVTGFTRKVGKKVDKGEVGLDIAVGLSVESALGLNKAQKAKPSRGRTKQQVVMPKMTMPNMPKMSKMLKTPKKSKRQEAQKSRRKDVNDTFAKVDYNVLRRKRGRLVDHDKFEFADW